MISEEEKNKYIENIDYYLNNLINIRYKNSKIEDLTATAIVMVKKPIFLIFYDLLNQISKKDTDIQRMQELLDKSDAKNAELNKGLEIKDKMIDGIGEDIFEHYKFLDRNYGDEYPLQYKNKEEVIQEYKIDTEKIILERT